MPKKQKGQHHSKDDGAGGKGKEPMSVSTRKLAATLWEINEVPELESKDSKTREEVIPSNLPDPSHPPISERKTGSGGGHQPPDKIVGGLSENSTD